MKRATYQDMPGLIHRRKEFAGNSAWARWTSDGVYEVMSYTTVIATYSPQTGWTIPDQYYSRTTSRLQNIVRQAA